MDSLPFGEWIYRTIGVRGNDRRGYGGRRLCPTFWIPAFAGMEFIRAGGFYISQILITFGKPAPTIKRER